jgi:hypothetical protein
MDVNEPQPLVEEIRKRRGGELLHLDRMLLHSPPFAQGWNFMLGQIRSHLSAPIKLRELIMCTIAILNKAEYEYFQHAPVYLSVGGKEGELLVLREKLEEVIARDPKRFDNPECLYIHFDRDVFNR